MRVDVTLRSIVLRRSSGVDQDLQHRDAETRPSSVQPMMGMPESLSICPFPGSLTTSGAEAHISLVGLPHTIWVPSPLLRMSML